MTSKHPHYDTIVAWANGKPIQYLCLQTYAWLDWDLDGAAPPFYPDREYRVKPEPKHDWVIEYQENDSWLLLRGKTAEQMKRQFTHRNYRQLVDVLDE